MFVDIGVSTCTVCADFSSEPYSARTSFVLSHSHITNNQITHSSYAQLGEGGGGARLSARW